MKKAIHFPTANLGPYSFLVICLVIFCSVFGYWYLCKRPYLKLPTAHLESFSATIHSDASGRISFMGPEEGDFVKRGERLFAFESLDLLQQRNEMEKKLQNLEKIIEEEKVRSEKATKGYLSATSNVDAISKELVDQYLNDMEEAQKQSEVIQQKIGPVKNKLEELNRELEQNLLKAPFTGTILKRLKKPGAVISLGDPLYIFSDLSKIWVEAVIHEKDLEKVSIGTLAKIQLPAYPKKTFQGTVSYIGPATLSRSSLTREKRDQEFIPIKISIETQNLQLKPGLSAEVNLVIH